MPKRKRQVLFIGAQGHVLALDAETGGELWRAKLKGSGTVLLHRDGEQLYASVSGELWCLDATNGAVRWHNKLKGLGLGIVSMCTTAEAEQRRAAYVTIAETMRQQQQAAHGGTA
jgi:outer membrane protein assembly factor BamB